MEIDEIFGIVLMYLMNKDKFWWKIRKYNLIWVLIGFKFKLWGKKGVKMVWFAWFKFFLKALLKGEAGFVGKIGQETSYLNLTELGFLIKWPK